ncbi:MAG: DNA methyltransferase [Methanobacterium sp.]
MSIELKKRIKNHIGDFKSAQDIFDLFHLLNYPKNVFFDTSYKREKNDFGFKKEDNEKIIHIYSILNFEDNLPVFLLETKTLNSSFIRSITTKFDSQYMRFLLIFSLSNNYSNVLFVLPNREKVEAGKYKLKFTKLNVNKEDIGDKNEHYTVIETLSNIEYEDEPNWRFVWKKWVDAFNVEKVTEAFFEDYKTIFFSLRDKIKDQNISQKDSHEFTLQFLNRIMFIYFVSKKGWLKYPKFMGWFWKSYKNLDKYGSDEYYELWLNQLFFKAFNNQAHKITDLPSEVKNVISGFPYLNGGLFSENKYDLKGVEIKDSLFQRIFEFFEKYNFTIKEDMPFESEVAVDPQMIGYVYESLANVADEIYDRNDMGIFYTPRIEVDFMCRRSLVEYLSKNLSDIPKDKLYHFVFDLPEDKWKTEDFLTTNEYWHELEYACDNLSLVDPACGSGAFLVGMLNVLDELYKIIYKYTERKLTDFERKYRIIQHSLYGVDVMPWAIHAAELRLWLQLIIETQLKGEELRKSPLLPNLNLNLRIGDSLVQEVGGVSFNVRTNDLDPPIRKKLEDLKNEKRLYFENSRTARFKDLKEFKKEETRLFEEIIEDRIIKIHEKVDFLQRDSKRKQSTLGIETSRKVEVSDKKRVQSKNEIKELIDEVKKLRKIKEVLKDPEMKPFVWDIDFAEIFGDKNGFDIVIGNPPYVRQEMISPPNKIKSSVTLDDRRKYKDKLIESVQGKFPVVKKIDKRSDYYIYFYFHGLSLLNENGTFCFITSNSWLDVGYGKNLQEFLLNYIPIIAIYDNPKRSFAHADVNTVITLFGAPIFKELSAGQMKNKANEDRKMLSYTAKFVMFKKPFESVANARNLIEIEKVEAKRGAEVIELVNNVVKTSDYRVFPIVQEDLIEDGWKYPKNYDQGKGRLKAGSYEANKWGGKFLRAPDIFYTILKKGKEKLVKIDDIADIKFGIKTGVNDFFFLPSKYFDLEEKEDYYRLIPKLDGLPSNLNIEKRFLIEAIKSPKDSKSLFIELNSLKYKILMCNEPKNQLEKFKVLEYIKWGENENFNTRSSVRSRKNWYSIGKRKKPDLNCNYMVNDQMRVYFKKNGLYGSDNLHEIHSKIPPELLAGIFNSSVMQLMANIYGRVNFGDGLIKIQVADLEKIFILDPSKIKDKSELKNKFLKLASNDKVSLYEEFGINPLKPISEQDPQPRQERAQLDNIIFNEIGLTENERKEVYWSVSEIVKQRLDKANSQKRGG